MEVTGKETVVYNNNHIRLVYEIWDFREDIGMSAYARLEAIDSKLAWRPILIQGRTYG